MDEVREKFFLKIVKKLESLKLKRTEKNLVKNKAKVLKFLKDHKWTATDMTSHKWFKGKYNTLYFGKQTGKYLKNTNGIMVYPMDGYVYIAYFN